MADNYLEKRMAELASGTSDTMVRFRNLDYLVVKAAKDADAQCDPSYKVHRLQLASMANLLGRCALAGVTAEIGEGALLLKGGSVLALGEALMLLRLKAADIGLAARVDDEKLFADMQLNVKFVKTV